MKLEKDDTIISLVERLELKKRGWIIVDHWEADLSAIGIANKMNVRRLIYVSTFNAEEQKYNYECENPLDDDLEDYSTGETGKNVTYEELVKTMERHLG